jgi:dolichol-phosphate mannosyltransferase
MLRFAWTAISSFSALPLRIGTVMGLLTSMFGVCYFLYTLFVALIEKTTVPGWTSLVCLQIIFSGAILTAVGLVGDYVARIYEEAKGRPLYVVGKAVNVALDGAGPERGVVLNSARAEAQAQHGGA